jgi:hypothetical protein
MPLTTTTATDVRSATPWPDVQEVSRKLDRYYRRDYSPIGAVLSTLFPVSYAEGQLHVRTVPFIHSYAREMATAYVQPPTRQFDGLNNAALAEAAYQRIGVDGIMRVVDETLWVQDNAIILTMPDNEGRITPQVLPPWRVEPVTTDPMVSDPSSVEKWKISLPRQKQTDAISATNIDDVLVLTATEAYWAEQEIGAWNDEGTNPLGTVPIIVTRASLPEPGAFYAPLPDDLLAAQEALIIDHTDVGRAARFALGQKVISGMSQTELKALSYGPDVVLALEKDQRFEIVYGNPGIDAMLSASTGYLANVLGMLKINPGAFVKSTTLTAAAKIAETADRATERSLHLQELHRAEQRLYRHIARWTNAQRDQAVLPVTGVKVVLEHHEIRPTMDPLHEAQAAALEVKVGLTSPVELIAKKRGISTDQAKKIFEENIAARNALIASAGDPADADLTANLDNNAGGGS